MRAIEIPIRLFVALTLLTGTAIAGEAWLHVRVEGSDSSNERVNINVPLSVVETMLPLISVDELDRGKLLLDGENWGQVDLREVLVALRESPDATFLRAQDGSESVRVAKQGKYLTLDVDEGSSAERIRIRVPLLVFDALVGDDPGQLDLLAGLRALRKFQGEELVHIESADETVRVWIDGSDIGE